MNPTLVEVMGRFSDEDWRLRKQAAESFLRTVAQQRPDQGEMDEIVDALLDGVVAPQNVAARAACNEVLLELGRATLPRLVARLHGDEAADENKARLLVDLLGPLGTAAQVPLLKDMLVGDQPNLVAAVATALGAIGGSEAIAALEGLLGRESEMLQLYALDGLRQAGARVAVQKLRPLLERPITRRSAAALLGEGGAVEALTLLVPLLGDRMAGVRTTAVLAIDSIHQSLLESGRGHVVATAMRDLPEASRASVRSLIDHDDSAIARAAASLAGLIGDEKAVRAVLRKMDDPVVFERALALVARLGPAANDVLATLSEEIGAEMHEHLLRLVGALQADVVDPRLLDLLMAGLADPSEEIGVAAAEALRTVGGRAAMSALYRCSGQEGPVGERAADALAAIAARVSGGRHDELMMIIGASWPHEGPLARNLCRVVGQLGIADYVPPLVSLLGSSDVSVRVAAAQALGRIPGENEGVGALCFALADEVPQVRASACRSLGELAAPQSCQPLLSATADPNPLVRAAAVQALVAIDNPVSLARLREIVLDDPVPSVVVHAIAGLGSSRQDQDLNLLMSLCCSSDHEVVKAAARALAGYRAHRATAALLGLLGHERWDVRWAASAVLSERGDATALGPLHRALEAERDSLVRDVLGKAIEVLSQAAGVESLR